MGKFPKPKFNDARRHRVQAGLSLTKFAKAKTTGYDKRREIERKRALQAKKINKFRKIRDRLEKEGKFKPAVDYNQLKENIGDDEVIGGPSLGNTRGKRRRVDAPAAQYSGDTLSSEEEDSASEENEADLDLRRIRARAGPAPSDDDGNDDDDDDGDSIASESDDGSKSSDEEEGEEMEGKPHPGTRDGRGPNFRGFVPAAQLDWHSDQGIDRQSDGRSSGHTTAQPSVLAPAPEMGRQGFPPAKTMPGGHRAGVGSPEGSHEAGHQGTSSNGTGGLKKDRKKKPVSRLERLAAKAQADKEAQKIAREEAQRAAEEHRARVAQVEAARKQKSNLFRQKTSRGQPLMKYRIEGLLEKVGVDNALFRH